MLSFTGPQNFISSAGHLTIGKIIFCISKKNLKKYIFVRDGILSIADYDSTRVDVVVVVVVVVVVGYFFAMG